VSSYNLNGQHDRKAVLYKLQKEFLRGSKPAFFKFDKGFYVWLVSGVTERDGDEGSAERLPTASGGDGSLALPGG
jgi:hypothetical protein